MSDCHRADARGIVKDGQTVLSQIIRDLRAATDYEIIDVLNGEEALVAAAQQRPSPAYSCRATVALACMVMDVGPQT
jgi:hypothetical protein